MSQLLNKLTNLVVNKITDENLIQTGGGQGSPAIILVDEDNDVTYGPDDYYAIEIIELQQNSVHYSYAYSKDSSAYTEPVMLASSQLKQGFYIIPSNSIVTTYDSNFQDTNYNVRSDTLINYTGQDSITIPIKTQTTTPVDPGR